MDKYDLVILGGGAAAFAAAIKASELRTKVAMIEKGTIGGTCVNVGCVPSKYLLTVGEKYYYAKNSFKGMELEPKLLDFSEIISQKDELVKGFRKKKYIEAVNSLPQVDFIKGKAKFISNSQVQVEGETIQGDKFIVATGSSTQILPIEGINKVDYLTNIEALSLKELPASMIILGGRALGLEFAQIYAHFGTKVTVLQRSSRIIPNEEPEISESLRKYLEEEGIEVYTGTSVKTLRKENGQTIVIAEVEGEKSEFKGEKLLMATGRKPNTETLSLEKAGVAVNEKGAIKISPEMQTTAENIWAAGDVTGPPMLETVAAKEGNIAAQNALTGSKKIIDYDSVPHAIFTSPQVASVGLTEKRLMEKLRVCSCRTLEFSRVPKAGIINDTRGLIKMVVHPETEEVVGVHILSPLAADLIHEATFAVKFNLKIDDIIDTVHIFPTLSESLKMVAQSFKKDISKMSCCVE